VKWHVPLRVERGLSEVTVVEMVIGIIVIVEDYEGMWGKESLFGNEG